MERVKVTSLVDNTVSVTSPELRFSRTWPAKGSVVSVDKEILMELAYDVGFQNMLKMGILYIDDMDIKKEMGLEPEDATEPTNIIPLTDANKKSYLTTLSLAGFKDKISKLSKEQIEQLCDYAIKNQLVDYNKSQYLKEVCGRDIIKAVELEKKDKEA